MGRRHYLILCIALVMTMFELESVSAMDGDGNLLLDGQSQLAEIHQLIREREISEQNWTEEKAYLGSLIAILKLKNEEIEDQLSELGSLVEQREADWKKLEAQVARAEAIYSTLMPVVDSWLIRVKALLVQAPKDLRTELSNSMDVMEHYPDLDKGKRLAIRLETLVTVLEKLNEVQAKAIPVIEDWRETVPDGEVVRLIYLGLGTALYQIPATGETGWYRYNDQGWTRVPVSGAAEVFLNYWNALDSRTPYGVFNFPYPEKS